MTRYPDGVTGKSFFEKHSARKAPDWARCVRVPRSDRGGGTGFIEQLVIDDLATLVWVANLAALELHVPQWRSVSDGAYGLVDLIVFDLDPGAPATIVECCAVAGWIRVELESRGLVAFPKTSGSKGLQLYARLDPPRPWEQAHGEAREIAQLMERAHPGHVLSNMRRDLREGKVLVDWSQNHVAKTTIAPYSLRALSVPTVSTPLSWDEVRQGAEGGGERLRFLASDVLERSDSQPVAPWCPEQAGIQVEDEDVRGVRKAVSALVLAPGATASRDQSALVAIDDALAPEGVRVERIDFPYRLAGRRAPDRRPVLVASVVAAARKLADDLAVPQARIALGGRSMGGRMCSIAVAEGLPAAALVLVSYPLHPPGKPDRLRVEHFGAITVPCLFVSGTRDRFATPEEIEAATAAIAGPVTRVLVEKGDHGLRRRDEEVATIVASWVLALRL
jgi:bifunctional non-homologous end joining protein LigD